MAKSMVERYEQVLAQDPASTVFVELAKALLEKGDHPRAMEVCEEGLKHHPTSVVARVLWGKALIQAGRPAQAMSQFDAAIDLDRDNAHAYNLIGEVLLHKGLYRSALPILKKAMALQPNEGRIKQWYEQAQSALAGGPAPVFTEPTSVDRPAEPTPAPLGEDEPARTEFHASAALPPSASAEKAAQEEEEPAPERTQLHRVPAAALGEDAETRTQLMGQASSARHVALEPAAPALTPDPFGSFGLGEEAEGGQQDRTIVMRALEVGTDEADAPSTRPDHPVVTPEAPLAFSAGPGALSAAGLTPAPIAGNPPSESTRKTPVPVDTEAAPTPPAGVPAAPLDPFAHLAKGLGPEEGTLPGLTSTFDALKESSSNSTDPFSAFAKPGDGDTVRGLTSTFDALSDSEREGLSDASRSSREGLPPLEEHAGPSIEVAGGLLGDLPPPPAEEPEPASIAAPTRTPPRLKRGLLDDLPDLPPASHVEVPKVELSPQATRAMADEYERELREKIKSAPEKRSFFARHAVLTAFGAVVVLALGAFVGNYLYTRSKNRGQDLQDTLASARKLIAVDTKRSLEESLAALERARSMDEKSAEAWALAGYVNALLVAEHGGGEAQKRAAEEAFSRIGASEDNVAYQRVGRYLLASGKEKEAAAKALLDTPAARTEVHEAAGRILLERKTNGRALERFKQALSLSAGNVRALVALGGYYQSAGDCTQALAVYSTAEAVSPKHPARTLGAAECRLEREEELEAALTEVQAIEGADALAPELHARRELALGQLLSHASQHDEAIKRLKAGMKIAGGRVADFHVALGEAHARNGDMVLAQDSLEAAFKVASGSERVKEALARVLIARDRPAEVLKRIDADESERRLFLVRGIAAAQLGQWKRARAELAKTQVGGKFPPEAIIQLTLADAAEGRPEHAQEMLEKTLTATRRAKSAVRVALGQVYWQRGVLDKARTQFEEALKDDEGYEGGCSLGRLLFTLGFPDLAIEPLKQAVARNGSHGEAREALGRAYIAVGKIPEGLAQLEAWREDNPSSDSWRGYAFGLYHSGKFKEADDAATRALKYAWREPKNQRIRAMIRFSRAQTKAAFASLELANKLEGDTKNPETFCEIGHAFLRQGDSEKAMAAFAAAVGVDATSPCGQIGQLAAKLPTSNRGVEKDLEDLAKRTPYAWDKAFANATLARVRLAQGSIADARKAVDAAMKQAPYSGRVHYALGLVLQRQKQEDKGIEALKMAAVLDGGNAEIRLAYADALSRSGELKDAVGEYETVLALGAPASELKRVKKALPYLKKKLSSR